MEYSIARDRLFSTAPESTLCAVLLLFFLILHEIDGTGCGDQPSVPNWTGRFSTSRHKTGVLSLLASLHQNYCLSFFS